MLKRTTLLLLLCAACLSLFCQNTPPSSSCGEKELMEHFYTTHPEYKQLNEQIERLLRERNLQTRANRLPGQRVNAIVTLPVVVHIIHNNGTENISDAQVFQGIQHLNEAYANTGYYDPADGVNTQIQFCMAQRDPSNNLTNGITRDVSAYTVMGGASYYSDDQNVKNINRWNPLCYINIWLVKSIPTSVVGYAYLPSAHGSSVDGIIIEAAWFGSSNANDVVAIHEMGHYLGLYHTFEGACTNNDCTSDGDKVCDTPPDQSTAGISCGSTVNSCTTDPLSGFATDQNDLTQDYMDYGNFNCMKVFTQGQSDRMNWFIQNVRKSLLACKSCMSPCPAPVAANFNSSATNIAAGTGVNFTNTSVNATGYQWYINNVLQTTATNFSNTFSATGIYIIKLIASSSDPTLCENSIHYDTIKVTCPVTAAFTPLSTTAPVGTAVLFTNSSAGSTSYQWKINGTVQSAAVNFNYTFSIPGFYAIKLIASNGFCSDSISGYAAINDTIVYTPPPTDSCTRYNSFQKTYATANAEAAYDIRQTADGNFVMAGEASSQGQGPGAGGGLDGLIMKINSRGDTLWSKKIGGAADDEFYKIKQTVDGGFIAVGYSKSYGHAQGDVFLVKTDAVGTVTWAKVFGAASPNGERGNDVVQTTDGGYAVVGVYDFTGAGTADLLVIKTDALGNLQWNRKFNYNETDWGTSIEEEDDNLIVAGYHTMQNPNHDALLMKLTTNDGTVLWTKSYDRLGGNDAFYRIYKQAYGYFLSDSYGLDVNDAGFQNAVTKTDKNGDVIYSRLIDAGAIRDGSFYSSPTSDGGYINVEGESNGNADAFLYKFDVNGNLQFRKQFTHAGNQVMYHVLQSRDGSYITAGLNNSGQQNDIFVIKTDINGNTAACPVDSAQATILSPQMVVKDIQWQDIRSLNFSSPKDISVVTTIPVFTINSLCSYIPCDSIIQPPVDTCLHITFQQEISTPGSAMTANDLKIAGTGEFAIGGGLVTGRDTTALLIYLNNDGSKKWAKQYKNGDALKPLTIGKVLLGRDGSFITAGSVADSNLIVAKLNTAGNIIWTKYFNGSMTTELHNAGISGIISTYDGGIAFCTYNGLVTKLDKDGNLLWSKKMGLRTNGLIQVNNQLLVVGVSVDLLNLGGRLIKMTESNGSITGTIAYGSNNAAEFTSLTAIGKNNGTYFINSLSNSSSSGYSEQIIFTYDTTGVLLNISRINSIEGYGAGEITNDGVIGILKNCFYKRNGFDNFDWSIKYPLLSTFSNLRRTPDRGFAALTTRNNSSIYLVKGDAVGRTPGCDNEPTRFLSEKVNVRINAIPLQSAKDVQFIAETSNHTASDINLNQAQQCQQNNCSSLKIQGFDSICTLTEKVLYTVKRFTQCYLPVEWKIDTSVASIINATDSSIEIQFKKPGVHMLYGSLHDGCNIIKDSLVITVFTSPKLINLGPDIQLCKLSTLKLSAGSRFASYLWNDGSVDSVLTVYNIGQYFVRATDYCGNQYFDTINISQAPDVPFDLGPGLTTCDTDTLTITAPGNFSKYTWSANYNINTIYGSSVKVWPATDTSYSVIAELRAGCTVVDTIHIKVGKSIPVHIGNDTSFCAGGTVVFTATAGFLSYLWQDGAAGQTYTTSKKGTYWVWATSVNGCISKDTAEVTQVFSIPDIKLGPDFGICINETHIFSPGSGYASYLWQDNSVNPSYSATIPGLYWVTVTDKNHCTGSDTVSITGYKMTPQHFLDSSAAICVGRNNILHAKGTWKTYLWSTQSHNSSTPVADAGDYWLEVTNDEGCSARDSIHVIASDCTKGIYFPNAFTPNGDSKNDYYRPIINGKIENIKFIIYNRLGEKVFESSDPFKGWDGTYRGKPQDPNTFVWYCSYQFAGGPVKIEKGTVILVR